MIAPPNHSLEVSFDTIKGVALKLLDYCRSSNWAGYDPYDALNSRLLHFVPFLDRRLPRLMFIQFLKRCPINLRQLLGVPKAQNPKAMGLFLSALLRLEALGLTRDALPGQVVEAIAALRSTDLRYWCWGYHFPWQTRTILVPPKAPNLVSTTFVANALLDYYETHGEPSCLEMAASSAAYIRDELYWTDGQSIASLSYPTPSSRAQVHNANFLGAALLCRVYRHCGDSNLLDCALNVARFSASKQYADGSWNYGEDPTQRWIDNFHTGYNLCALRSIMQDVDTPEFEPHVRRGLAFYRAHFFREDGAPKYFQNRVYPIDIHSVAQSIITLVTFQHLDDASLGQVKSVLHWALANMWSEKGYFYYQVLPLIKNRIAYMRWSQAWMLLALSMLLSECGEKRFAEN